MSTAGKENVQVNVLIESLGVWRNDRGADIDRMVVEKSYLPISIRNM